MLWSFFPARRLQILAACFAAALTASCGGNIGPTTPATTTTTTTIPATPRSIAIQGATAGTVGEELTLTAVVTFADSSTQLVSTATWKSSNEAVASVSAAGKLKLLSAGEVDITVSFTAQGQTVQSSLHVQSSAAPITKYSLFGVLSDQSNKGGLNKAAVSLIGGANDGRTTTTDSNGYYSFGLLTPGTFNIQFKLGGYEDLVQSVTLTTDTRRDFAMKALPPPPYVGTYNISISTISNNCSDISPGTSGTLSLSGNAGSLRISITERGITRNYSGSMDASGSFTGSGSGLTNITYFPHDFTGGISGRVTNNTSVTGTEDINVSLGCPNGPSRIAISFSGAK